MFRRCGHLTLEIYPPCCSPAQLVAMALVLKILLLLLLLLLLPLR
jgi:hypothetical protein